MGFWIKVIHARPSSAKATPHPTVSVVDPRIARVRIASQSSIHRGEACVAPRHRRPRTADIVGSPLPLTSRHSDFNDDDIVDLEAEQICNLKLVRALAYRARGDEGAGSLWRRVLWIGSDNLPEVWNAVLIFLDPA